jgi:outer membrane protein assembly factor BamA
MHRPIPLTDSLQAGLSGFPRRNRQISHGFQALCFLLLTGFAPLSSAQSIVLDQDMEPEEKSSGWLPYLFSTDSLGTAFGVGGGFSGLDSQRQAGLLGTVMGTTNDSFLATGALSNYRLPGSDRLFLDTFVLAGHFTDDRVYADIESSPGSPRAGSNDSLKDDFLSGVTNDYQFEIGLTYQLPTGNTRDNAVPVYHLDRGILLAGASGGDAWNPSLSGVTNLSVTWFSRYRDLDDEINDPDNDVLFYRTHGLKFSLDHNNTDFPRNPTRGSRQTLTAARDFGSFDSTGTWTSISFETSGYLELPTGPRSRQRVLALNFWTAYSPTWETDPDNPQVVQNRPPSYRGASLGGFDRLRAFPAGRFSDKAAVYYGAEYRLIPKWNPLRELPLINYFDIDWMQFVGFIEAGRVSGSYDADLFTRDLKADIGLGLRLMTFRTVVRLDIAVGEEGASVQAMYAQPFAR